MDVCLRQVLQDHEGGIAIGDKTGGDTSIGPASLAGITVRSQQDQIGIGFLRHIMQDRNGIITDGDVSLDLQFLHGELREELVQVTGGGLVVLLHKLVEQFRILVGERQAIDGLRFFDDTFEDELGLVDTAPG